MRTEKGWEPGIDASQVKVISRHGIFCLVKDVAKKRIATLKATLQATAEDIGGVIEVLERAGYEVHGLVLGIYEVRK